MSKRLLFLVCMFLVAGLGVVSAVADEIWREAEAADSISPPMQIFSDDPTASNGQYIGTPDGSGNNNDIAPATGLARYGFTALGGVYKVLLRVSIGAGNNSFWVRIVGATSQTHEDPDQPGTGWVRFNDIAAGTQWHWDTVHSNDHGNAIVNWTLPAGQMVLEIARRRRSLDNQ